MADISWPAAGRRLKLGFVGGGKGALVGEWHAMGARMSNRWDIVAGALSSKPKIARQSGVDWMLHPDRTYDDFRVMAECEALRSDGIDAVAICTPNDSHCEIAETFLQAGIDVICDKPMTATLEQAESLVETVARTERFLGVAYTYSFHSMVRQAKAMIAKRMLGRITQVHVEYVQDWVSGAKYPSNKQAKWRNDPKRSGRSSATNDIGTHAFQMMHFLIDKPIKKVSARFHRCGAETKLEDTAFMQVKIGRNIPGTLWVTQAAPGNACGLRFRIFGEKGGLEWNQETPELLHYARVGQPTQTISRGHGAGMLPAAEALIRLPRGHSEGVSDAWCNLYTEMAIGIEAHRKNVVLKPGIIQIPDVIDGLRGVFFVDAATDSHEADGAWMSCWRDE